jgi:TolB-like protein/Tfp pilus assembly protein PilF
MSVFTRKLSRFWAELKRRRVIHVITVYAGIAYVASEVISNISEPLQMPEWVPTLVIVMLILAFPFVVALSWIYDLTAKGIRKTEPLETSDALTAIKEHSALSERIENSIAVLPFQDMSQERDQGYFCEGIAEEILNILAHIDKLKVVSRTSSFVFKDGDRDIREIGKKLEVKNILEGSIRKSGNRIRITAQLINALDGLHIWSDKYDRDITDVFAIQDEISQAIVRNLSLSLEGPGMKHIEKHQAANIDAYLSFLKGQYHYQHIKAEETKKAIEYFTESLQIDPDFAPAYCGIARAYWQLTYWGNLPPNQAYPIIINQMERAREMNGKLDEIYFLEGVSNYAFLWKMQKAEESFIKALKINPNSTYTRSTYSMLLIAMGRHEEAIKQAMKAAELDPLVSYHQAMIVNAFNFAGRYEEAIAHCLRTEKNYPENLMFPYFLGFAYHGLLKWNEAISAYERSLRISGGAQLVLANLILAYIEMGENSKADKLYKDLKELAKKVYILPTHFYKIHHARGEEELAFTWFQRAIRERDGFVPFVFNHPYEHIRFPREKRYLDLLRDAGFSEV